MVREDLRLAVFSVLWSVVHDIDVAVADVQVVDDDLADWVLPQVIVVVSVINIILNLLLLHAGEETVRTLRCIKDDTFIIVLTSNSGVHHLCYDICGCLIVVRLKLSCLNTDS